MEHYNVIKVEKVNGSINYTTIGYINLIDKNEFETIHGFPLIAWKEANPLLNLEVYFDTNPPCYLLNTCNCEVNNLTLITNINNPEA